MNRVGERRKVRYVVIEGQLASPTTDRDRGAGYRAVGKIFHARLDWMRKHIISDRDLPT
jgi:hypothetical protein